MSVSSVPSTRIHWYWKEAFATPSVESVMPETSAVTSTPSFGVSTLRTTGMTITLAAQARLALLH